MTKQEIITHIRTERQSQGLSQKQLADLAGTYKAEISLLEAGKKTCTIDTLISLSDALGLSVMVGKSYRHRFGCVY